jgi:hypothetical protein
MSGDVETAHWLRWLRGWGKDESWVNRFGRHLGERRLREYQEATALTCLAYFIRTASPDELERVRANLSSFSPATRQLVEDFVDARLSGRIWGDCFTKLRAHAWHLEDAAARPLPGATGPFRARTGRRWAWWRN